MSAVSHLNDPRYWLAHCEGFEVQDRNGFLGWVDEVELEAERPFARALLVSPSHDRPGSLRIPIRSVSLVVPDRGLAFVGATGAGTDAPR